MGLSLSKTTNRMDYKLTSEFKALLKYIKEEIAVRYSIEDIDIPTFMLGVMEFSACDAHKRLKDLMLSSDFDAMQNDLLFVHEEDMKSRGKDGGKAVDNVTFNERFDEALKEASKSGSVSSVSFWVTMASLNAYPNSITSTYGVSAEQIGGVKKKRQQKRKKKQSVQSVSVEHVNGDREEVTYNRTPHSIVEGTLTGISEMAAHGEVLPVFGNGAVYDKIFTVWSRCDNNNVVLVGKSGVGKTATVNHLANMILHGDVPQEFRNKRLMLLNLAELMPPNGIKGAFEEKYNAIIEEADNRGNYIFFIDNLRSTIDESAHYSDMGTEAIMDKMLSSRSILFICTATESDYSSVIEPNPFFKRRLKRINLEEKTEEECVDIVMASKKRLEDFHNVTYSERVIRDCVSLSKRHIPSCVLPDTVIDILDDVGARYSINEDDREVETIREELKGMRTLLQNAVDDPANYTREDVDKINRDIVETTVKLNDAEKKHELNKTRHSVCEDIMKTVISDRCGKPVTEMTTDERIKLAGLETRIKGAVIGQDEAVNKVCRSVKRSRVGLKRMGKPTVFMFTGSTGTGKTYLSKVLAKEVFGDEKSMVRIDMGEYGDKTSVNKLYGSAPGYVGYDRGGVLTEAVKKNGYCVVLLDEIEKAAEEVHDSLLQVFDDGRMTDNKGVTVDFSNCIIIMTSNIGASEAESRGGGIGFVKDDGLSDSIIRNAIKRNFKPEFVNRIDDIVMFNKLNENDLSKIATLEVKKAVSIIQEAGYCVDDGFVGTAVDIVLGMINGTQYGARPIAHAVESEVMDVVSDYIITRGNEECALVTSDVLRKKKSLTTGEA